MRLVPDLPGFRSLKARLTIQFAAVFALAIGLLSIALTMVTEHIAASEVQGQLQASEATYERLWQQRSTNLQGAANLLAHDFGFLQAYGTGDTSTAASALANLKERIGVRSAFILGADGSARIGDGLPNAEQAMAMWTAFDAGKLVAVENVNGKPREIVAAPIMAPQLLGWIVFTVDLDQHQLNALEALSPIPISAGVLLKLENGNWQRAAGSFGMLALGQDGIGDAQILRDATGEQYYAAAKPLPAIGGKDQAALLLLYPRSKAMAAYRPVQWAIVVFGLLGLTLVIVAGRRTAARIVAPIARLDEAAGRLARGEHAELAIAGSDEIARLADSFNVMAGEIQDRERRISLLAYYDPLTGLPNRAKFHEVAAKRLAELSGDRRGVAMLCLDLDDFKGVNDTLGHSAGDVLLKEVALRLGALAQDGFVARLGGDEFAVMVSRETSAGDVERFAEDIIETVRRPINIDGHRIVPGTSIGIALSGQDGNDVDTLLRHADLALYGAKAAGRGQFCFFEESFNERAQERRQIEADLRQAIEYGEFELYYQPLFDLKHDRIGSFEALIRWNHPERGLVSPAEFIPIAEDTGLIVQIGAWALREACREAVRWPEHIRVAVNVSSVQFRREGLSNTILQALAGSGLAPQRLEIEITESIFMQSNELTLGILHGLRKLGVRIALDDFGTGYSSLSYLQSFPFDKIKIDRSFIQDLLVRQGATAVVRAITDLAAALGMETTAEGVEENEQLERLRLQGCTSVQGFLFSRPVRAVEIPAMLNGNADAKRDAA